MGIFRETTYALLIACSILASVNEIGAPPTTTRKIVRLLNDYRGQYVKGESVGAVLSATGTPSGEHHNSIIE